jgi:D-alanyl-D-alanine dipeptidase
MLWTLCALAGVAAFGLLMDVITLMFGQGVDSWPAAANHLLAATGALLLAATARSGRREPVAGAAAAVPAPSAAPRSAQLAACAGTVAFLPYTVMKLIWAGGGTFAGTSGAEMRAISERNGASGIWLTLESWGLDATALLAALGVVLLWGLVRPWGQVLPRWTLFLRDRRVPRWLPLTPALLGAATLAPYGVIGVCYSALATADVVTIRRGDFHSPEDALLVTWIGTTAFAVFGLALIVTARSYWLRTGGGRSR